MTVPLSLFALMFLNYGLNAVSFRALSRGNYTVLALTDACIAAFGFLMIGEVAHAQTVGPLVGYVSGGVVGSVFGLWLSKRFESER